MPSASEPDEARGPQFDLSSPKATVRSFTQAITSGDADSVLPCFLPGGLDYDDIQEMLYATLRRSGESWLIDNF